jgi:phenylacetate-CoA ligase
MEKVLKGFPEAGRFRAVITRERHQDRLEIQVEAEAPGDQALAGRLEEALQAELKVRGEVRLLARGALPADAKKVEDRRVWK